MRVLGSTGNQAVPGLFSEELVKGPITREILVGLKTRGLRRRGWYRALDRVGRGLVDLAIRWVDKGRSGRVTETLLWVLGKLEQALETGVGRVLGRGRE